MAIRLKVGDAEFDANVIQTCRFLTNTPNDSNARSTDVVNTMVLTGKILAGLDGVVDNTKALAEWSMIKAERADSYRPVEVRVFSAGLVVREVRFPNAFVVDYSESYGDEEGVGTFFITVRQKKDKFEATEIAGGFDA